MMTVEVPRRRPSSYKKKEKETKRGKGNSRSNSAKCGDASAHVCLIDGRERGAHRNKDV